MKISRTIAQFTLLAVAAVFLNACDTQNRTASPNYHINSMERTDAKPYCVKKCGNGIPKNWNKDK